MKYCRVSNDGICTDPGPLPRTYKNISGFDLDPENAKIFGWWPAVVREPSIPPDYRRGNRVVDIDHENKTVNITWNVVALTPEEIYGRDIKIWEQGMVAFKFTMPDFMEFHIQDDHNGIASSHALQLWYDNKILLRSQKPTI